MLKISLPNDWKVERLKDVAAINQFSLSAGTDIDYEFEYLEISNVDYYGVIDVETIERVRFEDAPSRARRVVTQGCTIVSSVRPNLQAVAHFAENCVNLICSTGFNVVQPYSHKLHGRFAYYVLVSEDAKQYFEAVATGVGYPAVADKDFSSFSIPLPCLDEQERIANFLDEKCKVIDAIGSKKFIQSNGSRQVGIIDSQLMTLQAYRKALIHECITGKRRITSADFSENSANA